MAETQTQAKPGKGAGKAQRPKPSAEVDMSASPAVPQGYVPRLKAIYDETIRGKMIEEFGYKNALGSRRSC